MSRRKLLRHERFGFVYTVRGGLILIQVQSVSLHSLSSRHLVQPWRHNMYTVRAGNVGALIGISCVFSLLSQFHRTQSRLERMHNVHFQLEERRGATKLLLFGFVLCVRNKRTVTNIERYQLQVR